jgi:microcystin degradation protein MlrC
VKLEFDDDAINAVANQAARAQTAKVQTVLDRVLQTGQGKTVDEVKALLQKEVRTTLGGEITDPELSSFAELLAAGQRVDVKPA